jgi:hypothetical protein
MRSDDDDSHQSRDEMSSRHCADEGRKDLQFDTAQ